MIISFLRHVDHLPDLVWDLDSVYVLFVLAEEFGGLLWSVGEQSGPALDFFRWSGGVVYALNRVSSKSLKFFETLH